MNDSYFNRKILNKLKRIKTQPSNQSLSSSAASRAQEEDDDDDGDDVHSDNGHPEDGPQEDEQDTRADGLRRSTSAGNQIRETPEVVVEARTDCSSLANNVADNNLLSANGHHKNKPSKLLRSRSRAVWLFIRAASSLSQSGSNDTSTLRSNHDESSTETGNSSQRGQRTGSLASRMRHSNSCTASAGNINDTAGHHQNHAKATASSSTCLPRFIVPRMNALNLPVVCLVKSLEGELMREVFVHRYELGQYLIDSLKASLGLKDCKYFGLKLAASLEDQEDVRQPWLDLNESICKQMTRYKVSTSAQGASQTAPPGAKCVSFYLRIKFYPPNLARIQDPFLRNYLWLQLRRDLRLGKLTSSMNNLTLLMACVLQHELGDYNSQLVERLPELNILPNQDLIEEQAIEVWKTRLINSKKHQVLMQFLRAAIILETYGFDYYPVRDHQRQRAYLLGFNYNGIKTIRNGRIIHHFRWHSLNKISYERRMIIFHIYPTENSKRKQILGFKCLSNDDCQNLYMRLLEQKYFFTVDLTYFDKSVRRPSCLEPSQSALTLDWSSVGGVQSEEQAQRQHQHFAHSGSLRDLNGAQGYLSASLELDQTNIDDDDYDEELDELKEDHGDEQTNGSDGHLHKPRPGDYRNHLGASPNWPQQAQDGPTSGGQFQLNEEHVVQRATFSRLLADNENNYNNRDDVHEELGASSGASQHELPIPTDGRQSAIDGRQHSIGPRNFIKSSSLQEQSCQQTGPLVGVGRQNNNRMATVSSTFDSLPDELGPALVCSPASLPQQLPAPTTASHIRHHHQAGRGAEQEAGHAPLQRQHSTLIYSQSSLTLAHENGHANSNSNSRDGHDDKDNSAGGCGGRREPAASESLLHSLQVLFGAGHRNGADSLTGSPGRGQVEQLQQQQQRQSMISLGLRFCLLVVLVNFLLRLTDGLSGALVELLTILGKRGGGAG